MRTHKKQEITMTKRLFLFAGYDKDCIIDDTLFHYVKTLSKLGDIVFVMDCDAPDAELNKMFQDAVDECEYMS